MAFFYRLSNGIRHAVSNLLLAFVQRTKGDEILPKAAQGDRLGN